MVIEHHFYREYLEAKKQGQHFTFCRKIYISYRNQKENHKRKLKDCEIKLRSQKRKN